MAPISSANPSKHVRIPGLLDGNIMVLIYTPDYFESESVTIMDFADDFVTLNRLHGMVVSRLDIEFYWSFGVKSPSFEEYLASLEGTRNGQAFKKERGNKGTWKEQTLAFQPDTHSAPNNREVFDVMNLEAGYPAKEPKKRGAPLKENSGTKKKKRRRRCRKNKVATEEPSEATEQADAASDAKVSTIDSDDDQFQDAVIGFRASSSGTSPAEIIYGIDGLNISGIHERPEDLCTFDTLWNGRINSRPG